MAETLESIPTLTTLLRKINTLEAKHGESSPVLLGTIAKVKIHMLKSLALFGEMG